MTKEIN